jgi:hypothetical protein
MDANECSCQPGDAEYLGAVAGMTDLYGRSLALGASVTWRRDNWPAGRTATGRIVAFDGGGVVVELDGTTEHVSTDELLPY